MTAMPHPFVFEAIGLVRSPFIERAAAPRQAMLARDVEGSVDLFPGRGFEHALENLEGWGRIWILFVFHKNLEEGRGFRPKVLPPRSARRQGLFATRSPHRPNPIGLSAVELVRVEGLVVHVRGLDLLDGTPVLDIKPYVAYADSWAESRSGWLAPADPGPAWEVVFEERVAAQLAWLAEQGVGLREPIRAALALGPEPHPYRRIRANGGGGLTLSVKDWRVDFRAHDRTLRVEAIRSGYKVRQLAVDTVLDVHRRFVTRWGC